MAALEEHLPQAKKTEPEGGFFVGVDLPAGIDASRLRAKALDLGLRLSDGSGFFPDNSGEPFLRLPFCALSTEEIEEGVKRLGTLVE